MVKRKAQDLSSITSILASKGLSEVADRLRTRRELVFPTFDVGLNEILGGGIGYHEIVLIWGDADLGKTTFCLQTAGDFLKKFEEGSVIYFATEKMPGMEYAEQWVGENNERFFIVPPVNWNDMVTIMNRSMDLHTPLLIFVDTITAIDEDTVTIDADDPTLPNRRLGSNAALLSNTLRVVNRFQKMAQVEAVEAPVILVLISQKRESPNSPASMPTGGNAAKFYPDIRLRMKRGQQGSDIKAGETVVAKCISLVLEKTKRSGGAWKSEASLYLTRHNGFQRAPGLFVRGLEVGVVEANGAWYKLQADEKWESTNKRKEEVLQIIEQNADHVLSLIEAKKAMQEGVQ